jgi:hypothetical protein
VGPTDVRGPSPEEIEEMWRMVNEGDCVRCISLFTKVRDHLKGHAYGRCPMCPDYLEVPRHLLADHNRARN